MRAIYIRTNSGLQNISAPAKCVVCKGDLPGEAAVVGLVEAVGGVLLRARDLPAIERVPGRTDTRQTQLSSTESEHQAMCATGGDIEIYYSQQPRMAHSPVALPLEGRGGGQVDPVVVAVLERAAALSGVAAEYVEGDFNARNIPNSRVQDRSTAHSSNRYTHHSHMPEIVNICST